MTRIVAVEFRKFLSRRLMRMLLLLVYVACAVGGVIGFFASADDLVGPSFTEVTSVLVEGLGIPLMMLGWLTGASAIGAEWQSRTVTTLLTWEPRRIRMLLGKAIAVVLGIVVGIILITIGIMAAFLPAAGAHGSMAGLDAIWWGDLVSAIARVAGIAAGAGLFGMVIATIGRNTAAAFGVGFVYLAVVESLIRGFRPQWRPWLIGDNAGIVLVGDDVGLFGHTRLEATLLLLAYLAAGLAIASTVFNRRDIG